MGGFLIVIGTLVIVGAIGMYLFKNPEVLGKIAVKLQKTQRVIQEIPKEDPTTARPRDEATTTEKFRDLQTGEWVEFDPNPEQVIRDDRQVTGRGVHQALNRSGREFSPKGEQYPLYMLDNEMLMERPDGWYWFGHTINLEGESAHEFDVAGEAFSAKGQIPRSHSFDWRGTTLTLLDVGYESYQHLGGLCHLPDGSMVKYLLAERADGAIVYLENLKVGTDRVWVGKKLGMDITPYVGRILRAA